MKKYMLHPIITVHGFLRYLLLNGEPPHSAVKYLYINFIPDCRLILPFKSIGSYHFLLKEITTCIHQRRIKSDIKQFYIVTEKIYIFQINAVLLNSLIIIEFWGKNVSRIPQKIFSSTTVFNIDNNKKYFLSSKSAY